MANIFVGSLSHFDLSSQQSAKSVNYRLNVSQGYGQGIEIDGSRQ